MIRQASSKQDVDSARELFREYAQWLNVDLCFQGFAEELRDLPGCYASPRGRLLIAADLDDAFGCIALRALETPARSCGEVKRLYVRPAKRNGGWGNRLVEALIAEARAVGYSELKLDTFDWMSAARELYARHGFRECAAYYA